MFDDYADPGERTSARASGFEFTHALATSQRRNFARIGEAHSRLNDYRRASTQGQRHEHLRG
eukprot:2138817-Pleurochrysis_carterae.AAC.2